MRAASTSPSKPRKTRARPRALTSLRRQEILAAAVNVFSRKGFGAARAEDIAHAAGIAKGTLYLYFRSKEALYSAAIAHAVQELQALSAERIGAAASFRDKLAGAIEVRLEFWREHEALYRLLLTLGHEARHRRQTNQLLRSGQQHLLAIFAEGTATKQIANGDYAALAWAILDMIRGATERRMERVAETTIEEDAQAITTIAMRSAGCTASASARDLSGPQRLGAAASTESRRIGRSRMRTPLA